MLRTAACLSFTCGLVLAAGCSSDLSSTPDAYGRPHTTATSTTTTTSTSTTTTTTTTTLPPVLVTGPVRVGAVCTVPGGVSTTGDNVRVFCVDRKAFDAKPFSGGKLRWVAVAS